MTNRTRRIRIVLVAALVLAFVLGGCGPKAPRRVKRPMPLPGQEKPTGNSAEAQSGRVSEVELGLRTIEDRVRRTVVGAVQKSGLLMRGDRGVDAACRSTSESLLRAGDLGAVASHLRLELQREQITDVSYLPFTFQASLFGGIPGDVLDFIQRESQDRTITHIGVGASVLRGNKALITVVLLRRLTTLSAFPREAREGSSHMLWVRPKSSLVRNPSVILASPDGSITDIPGSMGGRGLAVSLPFERGKGRYVVQVLAEDSYGSQVTNQMEVWVGQPAMRVEKPTPVAEWGTSRETQETQMVELVNQYRRRHGLQPLAVEPRLTDTARTHSEDMRDGRFFGHRSPTRGELAARTRASGPVRKVAENIAMSVSITWAHDGLIASPSHRRNLLDPDVTHLGVGVASRDTGPIRVVYVTQHLARY